MINVSFCPLHATDTHATSPTQPGKQPGRSIELSKSELAMSARNLMSSHEGFNLLYSNHTAPDSRRRTCKDNVNMIDHIKEQNIVEHQQIHHVSTSQQTECSCTQTPPDKPVTCQQEGLDGEAGDEEEKLEVLAKQEEAAAVEEIQNITSNEDYGNVHADHHPSDYVRNAVSRADDDARRSRLRRTCQNQNFDIYNNDYQDTSATRDARPSSNLDGRRTSSRMSPSSTNLFKESSSAS